MLNDSFHRFLLALPGAVLDVKFGDWRVYCVGGRMFAAAGRLGQEQPLYAFKASPMAFELLVEHGVARPAPYLQRAKWVELLRHDALGDADLIAYVTQAHAIVAAKLSRSARRELGL